MPAWTPDLIPDFEPPPLLRNTHLMTLAAALRPRWFPGLPRGEPQWVEVAPASRLRLDCHWQAEPTLRPTLVLVHGLEGSSESPYILGTAEKAWRAGFSVVRMNVRNCGGTENLTPTLYHSGLSGDLAAVVRHLVERQKQTEIHLAGFSMGGNMVLKLAGEWGAAPPAEVSSVAAVSPSLDLARSAEALEQPSNFLYEWHFLRGLKARLRRKARLFPGLYRIEGLRRIRTVREFDDAFTAPHFGFGRAENYYRQASALPLLGRVAVPTLILAARDDPFVPFDSFREPALCENRDIMLLAPDCGGHVGFLARRHTGEDRYWAENRVVNFFRLHSRYEGFR